MILQEYLMDKYGYNEPIFSSEIKFEDYSTGWIANELERMISNGTIKRFDDEVYYFSQKMFFGDSLLDTRKVIRKRYISNEDDVYGYIAGLSLLNLAGVSTQVPNLTEVVTNKESSFERNTYVGKQKVLTRRSKISITSQNAKLLQFLELMNMINPSSMDRSEFFMLRRYTEYSRVKYTDVEQFIYMFPEDVMQNIEDSGVFK